MSEQVVVPEWVARAALSALNVINTANRMPRVCNSVWAEQELRFRLARRDRLRPSSGKEAC